MRDLIKYLETEAEYTGGESRKKIKNWINQIKIMIPELQIPECTMNRPPRHRAENAPAIHGITRQTRPAYGSNQHPRSSWVVIAFVNNVRIKRAYSIEHYGEKQAFRMACVLWWIMKGKLKIYSFKDLPCRPPVPYEIIR